MDLSIIIVNWKSKDFVEKCLRAVYAQTKGISFEVIVVDSASFDGCDKLLAQQFPSAVYVQSMENIGFARSNNLGFQHSSGDTLLFLNPDTQVLGNAISVLFQTLHGMPKCGAVGARLLNSDGSLQTSCIQSFPTLLNQALDSDFLRSLFPSSRLWGTAALFQKDAKPASVEVLSGACIMIKREVFKLVGHFPEAYFMYSEDLELSYQVIKKGFNNFYVPTAEIVHHGGGSSAQSRSDFSNVMMRQSVSLFLARTRGGIYSFAYRLLISFSAAARLAIIYLSFLFQRSKKGARLSAAASKWTAIMKWSLGLQKWVASYR